MAEFPLDLITDIDEKTDANGRLTVTSSRVTVTTGGRDEDWFLQKAIAAIRDGKDFTIKFTHDHGTGTVNVSPYYPIAVRTQHTAGQDVRDADTAPVNLYSITALERSGNTVEIFFDEFLIPTPGNFNLITRDQTGFISPISMYFEFVKLGATMTLDAWTDSGKSTHISGFPLSVGITNDVEMENLFVMSSSNVGTADTTVNAFVEDVTVDFGGGGGGNQGSYFVELQQVW